MAPQPGRRQGSFTVSYAWVSAFCLVVGIPLQAVSAFVAAEGMKPQCDGDVCGLEGPSWALMSAYFAGLGFVITGTIIANHADLVTSDKKWIAWAAPALQAVVAVGLLVTGGLLMVVGLLAAAITILIAWQLRKQAVAGRTPRS